MPFNWSILYRNLIKCLSIETCIHALCHTIFFSTFFFRCFYFSSSSEGRKLLTKQEKTTTSNEENIKENTGKMKSQKTKRKNVPHDKCISLHNVNSILWYLPYFFCLNDPTIAIKKNHAHGWHQGNFVDKFQIQSNLISFFFSMCAICECSFLFFRIAFSSMQFIAIFIFQHFHIYLFFPRFFSCCIFHLIHSIFVFK